MSSDPNAILERLKKLHPQKIDLSLDRVKRLLEALGHPERRMPPVVHIAGTNGKGSTLAFLRAFIEAARGKVHAYISPHLVRFNERIRVGGGTISDIRLSAILEECEQANKGQPITVFEITTAAAFLAFSRSAADVLLLETGLGGRFDATNVIDEPEMAVITPIAVDHTEFLGKTLKQIATEKAGILKPGVPAIIGPQPPEAAEVILARAKEIKAPLFRFGHEWTLSVSGMGFAYRGDRWRLELPFPALIGRHQIDNAGLAVASAEKLRNFRFTDADIRDGIKAVEWPARLQRLTRGRFPSMMPFGWEIYVDGGHNPAAAKVLADLAQDWRGRSLHLVFGMLRSKDAAGFIKQLAPYVTSITTVPIPGDHDALSAEEAAAICRSVGGKAEPVENVVHALTRIGNMDKQPGRILICGSLYLAGEALRIND